VRHLIGRVALAVVGVILGLAAIELCLRWFAMDRIYYRPHELLATWDPALGHRRYKQGRAVDMLVRHGDLVALGAAGIDAEPRRNVFRVDGYGFRNDHDYAGERTLLVGDSFLDGTGNTQDDLLSAVLARECGVRAYNLAYPGAVPDYMRYVKAFRARHPGARFKTIVFLFEGNDFPDGSLPPPPATAPPPKWRVWLSDVVRWARYTPAFRESVAARVAYNVYQATQPGPGAANVVTFTLGRHRFGELDGYVAAARRASYTPVPAVEQTLISIKDTLGLLVFIPTKYRVYHGLLEPGAAALPTAHWEYVRRFGETLGVPALDLTPALTVAAERLFRESERFVFWKDDTHWNGEGVRVAGRALCARLAGASGW
jgi:hypothetical protein